MRRSYRTGLRIAAAALAFTIIAGLLFFANGLVGNPISRLLVNRSAKKYVAATYPHTSFELTRASYNLKTGGYYVEAKSSTSIDTHFTLHFTAAGKLRYDDYEHRVTGRHNTFDRINGEYRQLVDALLSSAPYLCNSFIGYGEIAPFYEHKPFGPQYGLVLSELELDKEYDVLELAKTAGHIVLYIEDANATLARAAEILLDLKQIFTKKGINFYAIDFYLMVPSADDKPMLGEIRVNVKDFLAADIYEEGFVERLAAAHAALNQYYAEQDAKR